MSDEILAIVTGGAGDARRVRTLAAALPRGIVLEEVDRSRPRSESARRIRDVLRSRRWPLVLLEGTGIAGGLNVIRSHRRDGTPYVVSSGDPIGGFFRTVKGPVAGAMFERYERSLYRNCSGYIGWSPYLTGMALRMGAPRGMTVEGGVDLAQFTMPTDQDRVAARARYGLPPDGIVLGVVGSLTWTARQQYCYGLELVEAMKRIRRTDISVLIVGDGEGRARMQERVPEALRGRIVFSGRVAAEEVPGALHAMDVGFVTQTLDGLGSYRLTTKLPEYLASGLPVAMSPIPGYFDYVAEAGWALPEGHPADAGFHDQLAVWIDRLQASDVAARRRPARAAAEARFDYDALSRRFARFIEYVLQLEGGR